MKKYKIKILSLLLIISFSACQEDLLEHENKNKLTADNWYQTKADFQMALNSCYTPLMDVGMFGRNYQHLFWSMSDRVLFETTGLDNLNIDPSTNWVYETYQALYFGLYRTSMLISKLKENEEDVSKIENLTRADYDYFMGQAKAIRGAMYFYLVTIFNNPPFYNEKSIPVDYLKNFENGVPEDFWMQLEKDLTDAISLLKPKSESEEGRITVDGSRAMLAKALLYKHYYFYAKNGNSLSEDDKVDLRKAQSLFKDVMNSGENELIQPQEPKKRNDYIYAVLCNTAYTDLVTKENNVYPAENNMESIWEVQYGSETDYKNYVWLPGWMCPGSMYALWYSGHPESYRNLSPHPDIYLQYETEGAPEPFDRDPRCYVALYFDGDTVDFREESEFYNATYLSFVNNKGVAYARGFYDDGEKWAVVQDGGWGGTKDIGIKKWSFPLWDGGYKLSPDTDPNNRRIIRFADVLLMYAETCLLLQEDVADGLTALNKVRQRVDMPEITTLTRDAIIHERDVELAFEGHRWFDIIRWKFDDTWGIDINELQWGLNPENSVIPFQENKHEYLPIPLNEIDLSEGELKQNPGW